MAKPMPITGNVLRWTLADRELSITSAAERLNVDEDLLESWIEEDAHPNKGQFDALIKLLGCNESFLFLPKPPEESRDLTAEFRKYAGAPDQVPAETAKALRTAQTVLRIAKWLATQDEREGIEWPKVPSASTSENTEVVAERLSSWLHWTASDYWGPQKTESQAAKAMRNALQDQRLVVLHLTMEDGVTRGFSLHDTPRLGHCREHTRPPARTNLLVRTRACVLSPS